MYVPAPGNINKVQDIVRAVYIIILYRPDQTGTTDGMQFQFKLICCYSYYRDIYSKCISLNRVFFFSSFFIIHVFETLGTHPTKTKTKIQSVCG